MPEKEIDRKVAIILATDVVNYSKHMETNESETVKNPAFHWNQIHLANIKEGKNDFQGAEEHVQELIKIYDSNDLNIPFKFHSKYNQQVYWDSFSKATLLKYGFEEK